VGGEAAPVGLGDVWEGGDLRRIARFLGDRAGVTAIEYALIAALIAMAIVGGVTLVGTELYSLYGRICSAVSGALGGGAC